MPSVSAVMGPGETTLLGALSLNNVASAETEAAAAVDPNETGILATFANSAQSASAGLSANSADTLEAIATNASAVQLAMGQEAAGGGQGIANPLGTQVSSVPAYTEATDSGSTSTSSGGLSPVVIVAAIAAAGGGLWWFEHSQHHHHHEAAA